MADDKTFGLKRKELIREYEPNLFTTTECIVCGEPHKHLAAGFSGCPDCAFMKFFPYCSSHGRPVSHKIHKEALERRGTPWWEEALE